MSLSVSFRHSARAEFMAHAPPHLHDLAAARVLVFRMRDTAGRAPRQSSALPKGCQPALRLTQRRKNPEGPQCGRNSQYALPLLDGCPQRWPTIGETHGLPAILHSEQA